MSAGSSKAARAGGGLSSFYMITFYLKAKFGGPNALRLWIGLALKPAWAVISAISSSASGVVSRERDAAASSSAPHGGFRATPTL
jgi:hypothetical protein